MRGSRHHLPSCSGTNTDAPDRAGASEPRNLAYMTRLGMWGFKDAKEMIELLCK